MAEAATTTTTAMPLEMEVGIAPFSPIVLSPDREPWERQPREPAHAWALFQAFRDMSPLERTHIGAYRIVYPNKMCPQPLAVYGTGYKQRYRWEERTALYDSYVDKKLRESLNSARITARVETAQLGRSMRRKAQEALTALQAVLYVTDEQTGERVLHTSLSPSAIAQLAKVGSTLERFALGLEDQTTQINVGVGVSINLETDAQLEADAIEILRARRAQRQLVLDNG